MIMALVIGSVPALIGSASGVHNGDGLELDRNIVDDTGNTAPDWGSLFDSAGNETTPTTGTIDSVFVKDFVVGAQGPDNSYYQPSTKDDQPINAAGGSSVWGCTSASNPTDKNEILNAYATARQVTTPSADAGDLVVYTGGERFANDGTAYFGAWFFQERIGCTATAQTNGKFTGSKTDKDLLVLVSFDNGGSNVRIEAFEWHPCNVGFTDLSGTHPSPIAASKCKNPALNAGYFTPGLSGAVGGTCGAGGTTDTVCATTNNGILTGIPWVTQDKTSNNNHTLQVSEFFEAGVNLTDIYGGGGNAPCFSSYLLETRSSDTLDATLKDFAGGELNTCGSVKAHKYHDLNANSNQDAGEPDLANWEFFIDDGDGIQEAGETTGTTNTSGTVTFGDVEAGSIRVCEVLKSGWVNTETAGGTPTDPNGSAASGEQPCQSATLGLGGSLTFEFGNYQPGSISGLKFNDTDSDGVRDTSPTVESGVAGITINLYDASETTPTTTTVGDLTTSTVTSGTGTYAFTNLVPGTYLVCEVIPAGYTQTTPTAGTACPGASEGFGIVVTLDSGESAIDNNFGNVALHKVIVLVCHEGSNELVGASVTVNGTTKTSSTDTVNMFGSGGPTEAAVCGVTDGATFGGLVHGTTTATVGIPAGPGGSSGH